MMKLTIDDDGYMIEAYINTFAGVQGTDSVFQYRSGHHYNCFFIELWAWFDEVLYNEL